MKYGSLSRSAIAAALLTFAFTLAAARPAGAQLSLLSVVDLAKRNSSAVRIAQADVAKAQASLAEARDAYVPSLTAGSAAGYSYGFLGGVPSVFNVQIQSLLVSFSQPDYIRAARASLNTATLNLEDALDQVTLDASLDYAQLATIAEQLVALDEQQGYAEKLHLIEQDRLAAGVENQIAATRAELAAAQADLRRMDLEAQAAVLRKRLADLTGLAPDQMRAEAATIPAAPPGEQALKRGSTAGVDAGLSNAVSRHYIAHGDARVNYRPQIGFGFNYEVLDVGLNNYDQYYGTGKLLRPNNFGIAAQFNFPLFNAATDAHARGSAADAVHADQQAEQGREQAEEQLVQLRQSFRELRAQARVADLQQQLAAQQLQSVLLQLQHPPVNAQSAPLTPVDEMQARIEERARYADALDARFSLLKAQLSILRVSGGLNAWVGTGAH